MKTSEEVEKEKALINKLGWRLFMLGRDRFNRCVGGKKAVDHSISMVAEGKG